MGCIIKLLVDGAVTLYRCGKNRNRGCVRLSFKKYINVPVVLPNYLSHYKYKHNAESGCNIFELICRVFIIWHFTQSNSLWTKTFKWTCFFDLQLRTFTSSWLIWWWALSTRLAPVGRMRGNLILKLHQIKIKSIFLNNLLYLDAVYVNIHSLLSDLISSWSTM